MIDISEKEIMSEWDLIKYSEPLVVIRCMAFNHEHYIADALDGFLSQKTTFPFYIFVHDDCSTDTTAEIIKRYEKKYPNIIKAVYEEKNLYSTNREEFIKVINSHRNTKYEAICEGDDYWIDSNKLQMQVIYMEAHEDCSITFTNGKTYDVKNDVWGNVSDLVTEELLSYKMRHTITLSNCSEMSFPPTASYVMRIKSLDGVEQVPACFCGDLSMRMYLMTKGYALYFSDFTCVYRINVPGSAMTRNKHDIDRLSIYRRSIGIVRMLNYIDDITNKEYTKEIEKIRLVHARVAIGSARYSTLNKDEYLKQVYKSLSLAKRIKIRFKMLIPNSIYKYVCRIKEKI